jgi:hypothetical protein
VGGVRAGGVCQLRGTHPEDLVPAVEALHPSPRALQLVSNLTG